MGALRNKYTVCVYYNSLSLRQHTWVDLQHNNQPLETKLPTAYTYVRKVSISQKETNECL
jgi:hypothetical protein